MSELDRRKICFEFSEITRKWISVMDAKASFLSALNAATLAFIWSASKLADAIGHSRFLAILATILSFISLLFSLRVILPKTNIGEVFARRVQYGNSFEPLSFFGFVAKKYPAGSIHTFVERIESMDEKAFTQEAIEQHYTMSHIALQKASRVAYAGWFWFFSALFVMVAIIARG